MAYHSCYVIALLGFYLCCLVCFSLAQTVNFSLPLKCVNLGNWLIIEGWMEPSLFDEIPNKDLLDGTQVQFMSTKLQKYLSAEHGGGSTVVANRDSASTWETFRLWRINETYFNFRVFSKQFVGLDKEGQGTSIGAASDGAGDPETFQIIRKDDDQNLVRIRASNGKFVQASSETAVTADYEGLGFDENDPSVFKMKIVFTMKGEYQLTNGLGPEKAPEVMKKHWSSYITEDDFSFMSANGLNAVRIPLGYWITNDPDPPKPFVGGSLEALDNAFSWAEKYGLNVILDLHGAQGSQNGEQHSASRDGIVGWGASSIADTAAVIEFLAQRYGSSPRLVGIALLNEPHAEYTDLVTLQSYYQAGYDAVRKHTSSAYVIFSTRLGRADPTELLSFASSFSLVAIDVHYYNLFSDSFRSKNVQQNIDFVHNQRASELSRVTTPNGPLSFVGEWTAEWYVNGASKEDYQRFAEAQLEVFGKATFGWAYWAYKCVQNHWSLKWMIQNNYIKL